MAYHAEVCHVVLLPNLGDLLLHLASVDDAAPLAVQLGQELLRFIEERPRQRLLQEPSRANSNSAVLTQMNEQARLE
jgi:hypothetical protein